jgi:hypothetical protein
MPRYRVATVEWETPFGEVRRTPSVQVRAGFFWWVTLTHCESVKQAMTYIRNIEKKKPEKVLCVVVK